MIKKNTIVEGLSVMGDFFRKLFREFRESDPIAWVLKCLVTPLDVIDTIVNNLFQIFAFMTSEADNDVFEKADHSQYAPLFRSVLGFLSIFFVIAIALFKKFKRFKQQKANSDHLFILEILNSSGFETWLKARRINKKDLNVDAFYRYVYLNNPDLKPYFLYLFYRVLAWFKLRKRNPGTKKEREEVIKQAFDYIDKSNPGTNLKLSIDPATGKLIFHLKDSNTKIFYPIKKANQEEELKKKSYFNWIKSIINFIDNRIENIGSISYMYWILYFTACAFPCAFSGWVTTTFITLFAALLPFSVPVLTVLAVPAAIAGCILLTWFTIKLVKSTYKFIHNKFQSSDAKAALSEDQAIKKEQAENKEAEINAIGRKIFEIIKASMKAKLKLERFEAEVYAEISKKTHLSEEEIQKEVKERLEERNKKLKRLLEKTLVHWKDFLFVNLFIKASISGFLTISFVLWFLGSFAGIFILVNPITMVICSIFLGVSYGIYKSYMACPKHKQEIENRETKYKKNVEADVPHEHKNQELIKALEAEFVDFINNQDEKAVNANPFSVPIDEPKFDGMVLLYLERDKNNFIIPTLLFILDVGTGMLVLKLTGLAIGKALATIAGLSTIPLGGAGVAVIVILIVGGLLYAGLMWRKRSLEKGVKAIDKLNETIENIHFLRGLRVKGGIKSVVDLIQDKLNIDINDKGLNESIKAIKNILDFESFDTIFHKLEPQEKNFLASCLDLIGCINATAEYLQELNNTSDNEEKILKLQKLEETLTIIFKNCKEGVIERVRNEFAKCNPKENSNPEAVPVSHTPRGRDSSCMFRKAVNTRSLTAQNGVSNTLLSLSPLY